MEKISEQFKLTIEESQDKVGEISHRSELQEAFGNLKQAEILLTNKNVEEKIEKQIEL